MAIGNLVKSLQNIMRADAGINGDAQRIEQMVWVIFLKAYDSMEEDWEMQAGYKSIIPEPLRWRNWAHSVDEKGKEISSMTGAELLNFVNNKLFPVLQGHDYGKKGDEDYIEGIRVRHDAPRHEVIVSEVFNEVNQYMKNGVLLRQLIDKIDEVDLLDTKEAHTFGNIYEGILKDLQSAGNAGEFYTPRAVTDFIIKMLDPKLGEKVGDFAMGTGGFLVSALNYMKIDRKTPEKLEKWQNSIIGQEWKPFPYLLAVTNILLNNIKEPQLFHTDSLGKPMSAYEDEDQKVNVIAMNPPYGGATESTTKTNFKAEYRSNETADLFMVLIMQRLAEGGRAGVIVPDGFLFGTDGPKLAIKRRMLKEFNLHTIIRLPGSVFSPYTSIATNILFFNNEQAEGAPEGFHTAKTWFYRLDKPEGYINFSKTKPMLLSHFDEVCDWWNNRVVLENGEKAQCFTPQEIEAGSYNLDLCKYPKEEEIILRPDELMKSYLDRSEECQRQILGVLSNLRSNLNGNNKRIEIEKKIDNPWMELSVLTAELPDKLKKSILQEAIMGKLGTQDPNDESVSALLEKIREEKKILVKEGILKKKDLEEAPIEEKEKPFDIPESWKWVKMSSLTYLVSGTSYQKGDVCSDGIRILRGGNIQDNKLILFNDDVFIPLSYKDKQKNVRTGDVIIVGSTGSQKVIGKPAIVQNNIENCQIGAFLRIVRPISSFIDKYLHLLFISEYYRDIIRNKVQGTNIFNIRADYIENILVPLPPLAEQERIEDKIEELFAELDNMKTNNINKNINEKEETEKK